MKENVQTLLEEKRPLLTKRLCLRAFSEEDAQAVYEYGSDEETLRYLLWPGVKSLEEARQAALEFQKTPGFYAITRRADGVCIGSVVINLEREHEKAGFGYALNRSCWNQGYMTEVLRAVLRFCFEELELNRVEAFHYAENRASGKVMQKSGMQYEGKGRQEAKVKGSFCDVEHYGILKKDWEALPG